MTPAPVSIVDRGTFCLMDLSRVGYVISICEYDERGGGSVILLAA